MGSHMSKKSTTETSSSVINLNTTFQYTTDQLSSYEAACKVDADLQSFDTNLQTRTNQVINTLAAGVEVRALSFDSLKEVTECLLEMNQEVVKVILECKKDIWKNQELFELVEEYFENSLQTLDFCTALEKCLKRARDSQLLILVALQQFEEEKELGGSRYTRTLEELKNFKAAGDPFNEEFFQMFQTVYRQQLLMLEKLHLRKNKLDKKLKYIKSWRKVSSIIFVATFAAVLICSVVAAAMAAPPVAAALAAATSIPIGSMGKWIDRPSFPVVKEFQRMVTNIGQARHGNIHYDHGESTTWFCMQSNYLTPKKLVFKTMYEGLAISLYSINYI